MTRALELARKGFPRTSPNPLVGCVLVKNNRVIAEGFHRRFGGSHAEIEAIRQAGKKAAGSTAYVTLEPCSYHGKTPPCTQALIDAGIRKVVAAVKDPNPRVNGRGFGLLKKAGIQTRCGLLREKAKALNLPFWTQMTQNRPYTVIKTAVTLDGKIADQWGNSKWITSEKSREVLWKVRSLFEAILVGIKTIQKDDPELTSHGRGRNPMRIIIDPGFKIHPGAKILNTGPARTLIVTSKIDYEKFKTITNKEVEILEVPTTKNGRLDLQYALKLIALKGIQTLLVEGGGITHGHFVEQKLFDEILWFMAPKILGGEKAKSAVAGRGFDIGEIIKIKNLTVTNSFYEGDLIIRGTRHEEGLRWPMINL